MAPRKPKPTFVSLDCPLASNLNFGPGQTIPNLVVVELGTGGKFSVYNAQGNTHVIADIVGWYGP